jgi:hypothetical protein
VLDRSRLRTIFLSIVRSAPAIKLAWMAVYLTSAAVQGFRPVST